jgi:threonine dehydrogenase-like Zn-dependent dehydrogenase
MEAHGVGAMGVIDRVKQAVKLENDRPAVLRQMIRCVRKGGTISILGVYSGFIDKFPMGVAMNKGLTFRMAQAHVQKYTRPLLELIEDGKIAPEEIITDVMDLEDAAEAYSAFNDKRDGCVKVVMRPGIGRREKRAPAVAETLHRV